MSNNSILEEAIEILTKQMIEEFFVDKNEKKYIITKQDLYTFSIKLIKVIKRVEDDYNKYNREI